ncbi:MAG: AAA family ATPase [Patescibacteria group bacterium]|nr:AAA family ATPase [Patescibacteria group bacterium]
MRKSWIKYYLESLKNFGEAVVDIFIFLPYFFSVSTLFKTLFYPWKNLQSKKKTPGFSFSEWLDVLFFNLISCSIGFFMRFSIIFFYFILQISFIIILPFIALLSFVFFIPIGYIIYLFKKTPEEEKQILKEEFIKKRCLKEENKALVEDWFEQYYKNHLFKKSWWKLENLMSIPPLARDWSYGYTPNLDQYAIDLASPSYLNHINNIVDREKEINQIELILSKNKTANVIVVGDEGVGKHTIIDALAKKIYLGKTNVNLMYKRILKIDMEKIGSQVNLFESLLDEAVQADNIILFIDNFEKYTNWEISLEKYASSDRLQILAITTPFFYQKFIYPNEKTNQFFSKVDVYEISKEEAMKILMEKFYELENYHQVIISYEAIKEAVEKSEFYLTYIPFPEKAVDLLDTACVYIKNKNKDLKTKPIITPDDINKILTEKTHVPVTLTSQMKEKLLSLELLLKNEVVEQDEAINKLSSALRRSFLLIGKRKKPLASFLFLGPTGVGKTQTAKAIAKVFFSSNNQNQSQSSTLKSKYLIRFDMSNYQSKYDIPKLIGDINTNEPGLLTTAIRNQPYGVLLLDELEKADINLLNIFLTVIDEGYFTDGFGHHVDCKNLVIIATSNAKDESFFPPEFINRFDGVITFNHLSFKAIKLIAQKIINDLEKEIFALYNVKIKIKDETLNHLVEVGYSPEYGARNMERIIRDEIEDKIAKIILSDKTKNIIIL